MSGVVAVHPLQTWRCYGDTDPCQCMLLGKLFETCHFEVEINCFVVGVSGVAGNDSGSCAAIVLDFFYSLAC